MSLCFLMRTQRFW